MSHRYVCALAAVLVCSSVASAQTPTTLDRIRATRSLTCGIIQEDPEYNKEAEHGSRGSFDRDLCQAFAVAAAGGEATLQTAIFLDEQTAAQALLAHQIDVIAAVAPDSEAAQGLHVSRNIFIDGVGLLARRSSRFSSASQVSGHLICFLSQTRTEDALRSWFEQRHLDFLPFPFQEEGEMEAAYASHNCAAVAGELTRLALTRAEFGSDARSHALLPDRLTVDPLAAATRAGEPELSTLVDATLATLLSAEKNHVTRASMRRKTQKQRDRTSADNSLRVSPGLSQASARQILMAVGSYAEIYNRAFGPKASRHLPRGPNHLSENHGLLQAAP